jgi:UPF0755 protein
MIDDDEAQVSPLEGAREEGPATAGSPAASADSTVASAGSPAARTGAAPRRARRSERRDPRAARLARVAENRARRQAARASGLGKPAAPGRTRRDVRAAVAVAALLAVIGGIAFGVWTTLYRAEADVPSGRTVTITIPQGATGEQMAVMLAKAGVVANSTMFRVQASTLGATSDMKPGTYEMTTGSSYQRVIRMLQAGPQIEYVTFTIPEGWGIPAIAARVEAKFGIPAADFIDLANTGKARFDYPFLAGDPTPSLEGYLFPKTYTLKKSSNATDVIDVMLTQYGKETAALDYAYAKSKGLTPHQVLTMASIIEREASLVKDRPKVASVMYNRLAIGMRLQLDSTVQFALNGKANLTLSDLQNPSPYNTYQHVGLPPGPICCPGLISIQAALHPAKTKYIYYILTGKDGSQSFTASYAQFLQLKTLTQTKGLQ